MAGGALEVGLRVACVGAVCVSPLTCFGGFLISNPIGVVAPGAFFATFCRGFFVPFVIGII